MNYRILGDDEIIQHGDSYSTHGVSTSIWCTCTNSVGYTVVGYRRTLDGAGWLVRREVITTALGNTL